MHLDSQIRYLLQTHAESFLAAPDKGEQVSYVTNYIGSKQKLVEWIWAHTPHGVQSVLDAFSGSAVVGYMYKRQGLRVVANDRLKYAYHIAKAIIENNDTTLSDGDIESLLANNPKAGTFVQDNFKGLFFAKDVHAAIDNIRTNIDSLRGYKKDIALFALAKACISGKGGFGHFQSSVRYGKFEDTLAEFTQRFRDNCATINGLVYDNGKENRAENSTIDELLPGVRVDLAYFDPPYATEFSTTNYESYYHFVEGLMTYWKGLTINDDSATHKFVETAEQTVTQATAETFFETFLRGAASIGCWIISYRDHAYPNEAKIKSLIAESKKVSRMFSKDHSYQLAGNDRRGDASQAKEHIFVCGPTETAIRSEADWEEEEQLLSQSSVFFTIADVHAEAKEDTTRVTAYMGSKVAMLDWIWKNTPDNVTSVLDLFSGGANVGYFYKQKGLRVVANDLLKYPFHIAKAVIENSSVTLSDDDIDALMADNAKAGDFIVKNFHGYYYTEPILQFLDNTYANIQALSGYKKNLALFAVGRACLIRACFGQFSRSKKSLTDSVYRDGISERYRNSHLGNIPISEFKDLFVKCLHDANALVFDNGQDCKAYNQQALTMLAKQKVDLVYADPPYITQFGYNDYANNLHFVEGLMTYWDGITLHDNDRRDFDSPTKYDRESIGVLISGFIDGTAQIGAQLMMSYRDKAFPTAAELKEMLNAKFNAVDFKRKSVAYNIVRTEEDADSGRFAQEYLLIANSPKALKAAADNPKALCHATLQAEIKMIAEAQAPAGDPVFTFILTHTGTNLNGDNFTREELIKAAPTAINRKVDLKHSQDLTDIVGGITDSQWKEEEGGLVECTGKLFVSDNPNAQLAYRLIKEGIVRQVSMECQYDTGECSICHKSFSSKADYCIHLRKYKAGEYQGKPVYEILHGVVFTGVGLLADKGADERAVIRSIAKTGDKMKSVALSFSEYFIQQQRSMTLLDLVSGLQSYLNDLLNKVKGEELTNEEALALMQNGVEQFRASLETLFQNPTNLPTVEAKKVSEQKPPETPPASEAAPNSDQLKALQQENGDLKKQVDDLTKQLDTLKKTISQDKAKAKATELVQRLEQKGRKFENDADRETEIARLAALSEDALAAVESSIATIPDLSAQANHQPVLKTDAGAKPVNVPDTPPGDTLGTELKEGFMAVYQQTHGAVATK